MKKEKRGGGAAEILARGTNPAPKPRKRNGGRSFGGLRPTRSSQRLVLTAIEELANMALTFKRRQCPRVPAHAIRKPTYSDSNANQLTASVRDFLVMRGHHCNRVNTQGQYRQDLGRYTFSGSTRGAADLNAIINGRSVQIEVKHGRDRLSQIQIEQKASVEAAGRRLPGSDQLRGFHKAVPEPHQCTSERSFQPTRPKPGAVAWRPGSA